MERAAAGGAPTGGLAAVYVYDLSLRRGVRASGVTRLCTDSNLKADFTVLLRLVSKIVAIRRAFTHGARSVVLFFKVLTPLFLVFSRCIMEN